LLVLHKPERGGEENLPIWVASYPDRLYEF